MKDTLARYLDDYKRYCASETFDSEKVNDLVSRGKVLLLDTQGEDEGVVLFAICFSLNEIIFRVAEEEEQRWGWIQEYTEEAVYFHRLLVDHSSFDRMDSSAKAQIYCNLASHLSRLGRFIEAIRLWKIVDIHLPMHPNVVVNWCKSLEALAASLSNTAEINVVLCIAQAQIIRVLRGVEVLQELSEYAESVLDKLEELKKRKGMRSDCLLLQGQPPEKSFSFPELSLNPLVECNMPKRLKYEGYSLSMIPQDVPKVKYSVSLFESLRRDYLQATCHFRYSHSLRSRKMESLSVIELRRSYELAYSLYDKAALLVNHVFGLHSTTNEWTIRKINIRSVWYQNLNPKDKKIAHTLEGAKTPKNWPLRGLYWLAKDVHIQGENYPTMSPFAEKQSRLRNFLAHRFIAVASDGATCWDDILRVEIGIDDFCRRTYELLTNVREAVIYLNLALSKALSHEIAKALP